MNIMQSSDSDMGMSKNKMDDAEGDEGSEGSGDENDYAVGSGMQNQTLRRAACYCLQKLC